MAQLESPDVRRSLVAPLEVIRRRPARLPAERRALRPMVRTTRSRAAALLAAVMLLLPTAADATEPRRGPPFSDPAATFPMSGEWASRPILHEAWAGSADLAVTLEQDVYQLLLPLIRAYAAEQGITIAVQEGTCGISAGALARRAVDVGGYCCPPGREDRLPGLRFHTIGIVAKALLVNPANPVAGVTLEQAREIFSGRIRRWSGIRTPGGAPGPDRPIRLVARFHCPARPGHWRLLLDNEDLFGLGVNEVRTISDMLLPIARDPDAVGWEVPGMVEYYRELGPVKALAIDGHEPTDVASLTAGAYPIYRTYTLTTWEGAPAENPRARGLVDHLVRAAEKIDPRYGLAPAARLREAGWRFEGDELAGEQR